MEYVRWDKALELGIPEIDAQHKKLVDLTNELYNAVSKGSDAAALQKILQGLAEYAAEHFATEEKYFDQFGYSDAHAHRKQHEAFVSKVADFYKEFDEGDPKLPMEMMVFLRQWLVKHIQRSDSQYVPLFEENGLGKKKEAELSIL